jgi:hypothetical protein
MVANNPEAGKNNLLNKSIDKGESSYLSSSALRRRHRKRDFCIAPRPLTIAEEQIANH